MGYSLEKFVLGLRACAYAYHSKSELKYNDLNSCELVKQLTYSLLFVGSKL